MFGWIILFIVLLFAAVILFRTIRFQPLPQEPVESEPISVEEDRVIRNMQDMIRCRTVSNLDPAQVEWGEFEKFQMLLQDRYPLVHRTCTLRKIGPTGLLYHLPGKASDQISVCMAHYDVVPVHEEGWSRPAFDGLLEGGVLWGRGTLDTKGTLCGILEALETLLADGYVPAQDLYLSFSGDEEISGTSCPEIVKWFEENNIKPALVVDEGGAVVDNVFPGVTGSCALIGIAEKGYQDLDFVLETNGGHASTPPARQSLGHLSRAVCQIEKHPFPYHLSRPVQEMFNTLGRHSSFGMRMLFANLWCFGPVLDLFGRLTGGELNAMIRSTVAITRFEGSKAYNVLPPKASFSVNMRLVDCDNQTTVIERLRKIIKNDQIQIRSVEGMNPSAVSDTNCLAWETLKTAIRQTWPDALVSPYLMMACSDSRHYNRITDRVYRFSAMRLSKEERAMIHGNDERIPVETLLTIVRFYVRLLRMI